MFSEINFYEINKDYKEREKINSLINGNKVNTEYFSDSKKKMIDRIHLEKLSLELKIVYNNNGLITFIGFYKDNKLNGKYICYDNNGLVSYIVSNFENGIKNGLEKWYYKGEIIKTNNWVKGKLKNI